MDLSFDDIPGRVLLRAFARVFARGTIKIALLASAAYLICHAAPLIF